ncbi:hypothetical protein HII31_07331 [Pseudocercospora fuligena]|uniref:Uncharacterized protein n=1 Tax=Pseudocercospora fuligena TaxID=685502 RepID=A0A8H6VGB9_9PEZI|nr:hypothetical protein HII31_07331 [Pseudocercospora fuligena]
MADYAFVHVFALAAIAAMLADHHMPQEDKSTAWYLALVCLCPFLALEVAIWSFALYLCVQNAWLTTLEILESFWTIIKTYPATATREDPSFLGHSTTTFPIDLSDALFVFLILAVAGAAIYVSLLNPAQESDSEVSRNVSAARPHNAAEPSSNALSDAVAIDMDAVADQTSSPVEGPVRVTREDTSHPPEEAPSADDKPAPTFAPAPTSAQDPRFHTWLRRVDLPWNTRCYAPALLCGSDIWLLPIFPWRSKKEPMMQKMVKEQEHRIEDILQMRQQCPGAETDAKIAKKYGSFYWPKSDSSTTSGRKKFNVFKNKTSEDKPREEPKTSENKAHSDKAQADSTGDSEDNRSNSHDTTTTKDSGGVPQSQNPEPEAQRTPTPVSQEPKSFSYKKAEDSAVPKEQHEEPIDDITTDSETAPSQPEAQATEDAAVISASSIHSVENNSDQVAASEGHVLPKTKDHSEEKAAVDVSQVPPDQEEPDLNSKEDIEEPIFASTTPSVENNSDHVAASTGYSPPSVEDQVDEGAPVAVPVASSQTTPDQGEPKGPESAQAVQESQVNKSDESSSAVNNVASAPTHNGSYAGGVESGLQSTASLSGNDGSEESARTVDYVTSAPTHNVSYADGVESGVQSTASSIGNNDSRGAQTNAHPQHQEAPIAAGNHDVQDDIDMTNANAGSELSNDAREQHQTFTSDDAMEVVPSPTNGPDTEVQAGLLPVEHQIGAPAGESTAGDVMNIDQEAVEQTMPAIPPLIQNLEASTEEQNASDPMDEDMDEEMPEVPTQDETQPTNAHENGMRPSNFAPAPIFTQPPQSPLFNAPMQMSMNGGNAIVGSVAAHQNAAGPTFNAGQNEPTQGVTAFNGAPQPSQFSFGATGVPSAFGSGFALGNFTNSVNSFAPSGASPAPFSNGSIGGASTSIPAAVQPAQQPGVVRSEHNNFDDSFRSFSPQQQSANTFGGPSLQSQVKPFKFDTSMLNLGNSSFGLNQRPTERSEDTLYPTKSATVVQTSLPRNDQHSIAARSGQPSKDSQEGVAELTSAQAMQSEDVTPNASRAQDSANQETAPEADSSEPSPRGPLHQEGLHVPVLGQPAPMDSAAFEGSVLPRNILKATGPSQRRRAPATSSTAPASNHAVPNKKQTKRPLDEAEDDVAAENSSSNELVRAEQPVRPYVRQEAPDHADRTKAEFAGNRPINILRDYDITFDVKLEHARKLMSNWYRDLPKKSMSTCSHALEQCLSDVKECHAFFGADEEIAHAPSKKKLTANDKVSDQQLLDLDTCLGHVSKIPEDTKAVQATLLLEMGKLRKTMEDKRERWVSDEREQNCQGPDAIDKQPKWMHEKVLATCKDLIAQQQTALSVENELNDPNSELQQDFLMTVNGWMSDLILFKEAREKDWDKAIGMSWGKYTASLMRDMEAALRPIVERVGKERPFKSSARRNALYALWDDIREGKVAQSLIKKGVLSWVAEAIPYPVSKGNLDNDSGAAKSNRSGKRGPIAGFMTSKTTAPTPEEQQLTIIRASRPNVNGTASSSKSNESQAHRLPQNRQSNAMASPGTTRDNPSLSHARDEILRTADWPIQTVPGLHGYLFNQTIENISIQNDLSSDDSRVRQDMKNMDICIARLAGLMGKHEQAWKDVANGVFGRRFLQDMALFATTLQNFLAPWFGTGKTGFEFLTSLLRNLQTIIDDLRNRHLNLV